MCIAVSERAAPHKRLVKDVCCFAGCYPVANFACVDDRTSIDCLLGTGCPLCLCPARLAQRDPLRDYGCIVGFFPVLALFCGPRVEEGDHGLQPGCAFCGCFTCTLHECNVRRSVSPSMQ